MKLFVGLFLFLSLIASSAFAFADACDSVKNSQQVSSLDQTTAAEVTLHQPHSHDNSESSHEHCDLHCTHNNIFVTNQLQRVVVLNECLKNSTYIFSYSQTFLESPFRPPLV